MLWRLGSRNHGSFSDTKCGKVVLRTFISLSLDPAVRTIVPVSSLFLFCGLSSPGAGGCLVLSPGGFCKALPVTTLTVELSDSTEIDGRVTQRQGWDGEFQHLVGFVKFHRISSFPWVLVTRININHVNHLSAGRLSIPVHHIVSIADWELAFHGHGFPLFFIHCRYFGALNIVGTCGKEGKMTYLLVMLTRKLPQYPSFDPGNKAEKSIVGFYSNFFPKSPSSSPSCRVGELPTKADEGHDCAQESRRSRLHPWASSH